jgi:hypothetical protein
MPDTLFLLTLVNNVMAALAHAVAKRPFEVHLGPGGTACATRHGACNRTQGGTPAQAATTAAEDAANSCTSRRSQKST